MHPADHDCLRVISNDSFDTGCSSATWYHFRLGTADCTMTTLYAPKLPEYLQVELYIGYFFEFLPYAGLICAREHYLYSTYLRTGTIHVQLRLLYYMKILSRVSVTLGCNDPVLCLSITRLFVVLNVIARLKTPTQLPETGRVCYSIRSVSIQYTGH